MEFPDIEVCESCGCIGSDDNAVLLHNGAILCLACLSFEEMELVRMEWKKHEKA